MADPTDTGLLAKAIGTMSGTVARIKAAGGATRTRARDRRRSAGRRARSIASKLRLRGQQQRDEAQAAVRRITGELAEIAEQAMGDAAAVLRNAKRALRRATGQRKARLHRAINHLNTLVGRTGRVVAQARSRLTGVMPESATRLVTPPMSRYGKTDRHGLPAIAIEGSRDVARCRDAYLVLGALPAEYQTDSESSSAH